MKFLKSQPVEFYVSTFGYLVFKNYEIKIILNPEQSKILQKMLPELIEQQDQVWTGIDEVFDSVFTTISVEECGNSSSYAMKCAATSGTSNETHIQRLQVELSVERAIYIDMLASIVDNIHSERADVDLTPSSGSWAPTWVLSGARSHFNQGRFDASIGTQNGRLVVEGENCVYTAIMTEPNVQVDMDGLSNAGIVLTSPNITHIGRMKSGNDGRVQIIGGQIDELEMAISPSTKAPAFLAQGTNIGLLLMGNCGNPALPEQVVFTECEIDEIQTRTQ